MPIELAGEARMQPDGKIGSSICSDCPFRTGNVKAT